MVNDLIISEAHNYNFASIDLLEMVAGHKKVYFGAKENGKLCHRYAERCFCNTKWEYIELYAEQIISHESVHFAIWDACAEVEPVRQLDNFDNWHLNPISFAVLSKQ